MVVSGRSEFDTDMGPVSQEIPDSLVARVREVPGVQVAAGSVEDFASIFKANGDQVKTRRRSAAAVLAPARAIRPARLRRGRAAATPRRGRDQRGHGRQGGPEGRRPDLRSWGAPGRQNYTISGLAKFGDVSLDRRRHHRRRHAAGGAARSPGSAARSTRFRSPPSPASPRTALVDAHRARDARTRSRSRPGSRTPTDESDSVKNSLGFLNTLLLVFAGHRGVRGRRSSSSTRSRSRSRSARGSSRCCGRWAPRAARSCAR